VRELRLICEQIRLLRAGLALCGRQKAGAQSLLQEISEGANKESVAGRLCGTIKDGMQQVKPVRESVMTAWDL